MYVCMYVCMYVWLGTQIFFHWTSKKYGNEQDFSICMYVWLLGGNSCDTAVSTWPDSGELWLRRFVQRSPGEHGRYLSMEMNVNALECVTLRAIRFCTAIPSAWWLKRWFPPQRCEKLVYYIMWVDGCVIDDLTGAMPWPHTIRTRGRIQ